MLLNKHFIVFCFSWIWHWEWERRYRSLQLHSYICLSAFWENIDLFTHKSMKSRHKPKIRNLYMLMSRNSTALSNDKFSLSYFTWPTRSICLVIVQSLTQASLWRNARWGLYHYTLSTFRNLQTKSFTAHTAGFQQRF